MKIRPAALALVCVAPLPAQTETHPDLPQAMRTRIATAKSSWDKGGLRDLIAIIAAPKHGESVRTHAVNALRDLGSNAKAAVPECCRILVREHARPQSPHLGADRFPELLPSPLGLSSAIWTADADAGLQILAKEFGTAKVTLRVDIARIAGYVSIARLPAARRLLTRGLTDTNERVRDASLVSVAKFSTNAEVVATLAQVARDTSELVRAWATRRLLDFRSTPAGCEVTLQHPGPAGLAALARALGDPAPLVRGVALDTIEILQRMEPEAQPPTPQLLDALRNSLQAETDVERHRAASIVAGFGPAARRALPELQALAASKLKADRDAALPGLILLHDRATAVRRITAAFAGPDSERTAAAAEGLRRRPALLRDLLTQPNAIVRVRALNTFYEPDQRPNIPGDPLRIAIADPDAGVRASALRLVNRVPARQELVPDIAPCLNDSESAVRVEALRCLGFVGTAAKPSIPRIAKFLASPRQTPSAVAERRAAAAALERIGEHSVAALPTVIRALAAADGVTMRRLLRWLKARHDEGAPVGPALPTIESIAKTGPRMARQLAERVAAAIRE